MELARWCDENKLPHEAERILIEIAKNGGRIYATKALEVRKKIDKKKAVDPKPELWKEFLKRSYDNRRQVSDDYENLANLTNAANKKIGYVDWALKYDAHNESLRKARGEKRIEGFGWYTEEEYKELAARQSNTETKKTPAGKGIILFESEHYTFLSELSFSQTKKAALHAELHYKAFRKKFGSIVPEPVKKLGIRLVKDKEKYKELLALYKQPPSYINNAGFFLGNTGEVFVFEPKTRDRGGVKRTLSHECTHQLMSVGMCGDPYVSDRVYYLLSGHEFAWCVEGIAVYFESLRKSGKTFSLGGLDTYRKHLVDSKTDQKKLDELNEFMKLDRYRYSRGLDSLQLSRRYAMGGALAEMCMHSKTDAIRDSFLTMVQRYYRGFGTKKEFDVLLDKDEEQKENFDKAWKEHIGGYLKRR